MQIQLKLVMFKTDLITKALLHRPNYSELVEDLIWEGPISDKSRVLVFTVPPGFVTDFASVPRALRWMLNPNGRSRRAAVLHDFLYTGQHLSRKDSDLLFLAALKADGVGLVERQLLYRGVRMGGWLFYNECCERAESHWEL